MMSAASLAIWVPAKYSRERKGSNEFHYIFHGKCHPWSE
jgi:hypothetical protein